MNTGRTIQSLLQEVELQAKSKQDFVLHTSALTMTPNNTIEVKGQGEYALTKHASDQIGERLGIPKKYWDRMQSEAPALLATNVNHWFTQKPERRMVRTMVMDNKPMARAFLSDRYRRLDNYDLAVNVLPEIMDQGLEIVSCEITERKLYLKFLSPRITGEVKKNDIVQAGGVLSNSEIGMGALSVQPYLVRLVCTNGMIASEFGQRRYHTGRAAQNDEEAYSIFSDETLQADDKAFWLRTRDTVRAVLDQSKFDLMLTRMRESTEQRIEGDVPAAVEVLSNKYQLGEEEKKGVLRHLIEDGAGLSLWGMINAITSVAGETKDYDRSSALEALGGQTLALSPSDWKTIATATT